MAEYLEEAIPDAGTFAHPAGSAGALMSPAVPVADFGDTVLDARNSLREFSESPYEFNRVYLVGDHGRLEGLVTVADLALQPPETLLSGIAEPVVATVNADTPASECARLRRRYGIVQLPVVSDGVLTGVIPLELLLSALGEEDTRQMLNVGGVAGDSRENTLVSSISTLLPWLTVNLGTTFLAAAAISLFESTLAQVVILASFLPVVAGQGGIGGTQTLTKIVLSLSASLHLLVIFGWMFTTNPDRYFLTLPLLAALHVFAGIAAAGVQLTIQTLALKSAPGGSATPYVGIAGMATAWVRESDQLWAAPWQTFSR